MPFSLFIQDGKLLAAMSTPRPFTSILVIVGSAFLTASALADGVYVNACYVCKDDNSAIGVKSNCTLAGDGQYGRMRCEEVDASFMFRFCNTLSYPCYNIDVFPGGGAGGDWMFDLDEPSIGQYEGGTHICSAEYVSCN